jgi:CHAD domain-containing protein
VDSGSATGGANSPATLPIDRDERISSLGRKRLEKFAVLLPRVIVTDDAETIHDARVWSRRLQQILSVLAGQSANKNRQRKLMRALRRVRKILGRPRNLDVVAELVEEKIAVTSNSVARDAWDQLRTHLKDRRSRATERSREKLRGFDIVDLAARSRAIIEGAGSSEALEDSLKQGVAVALAAWRDAIATAKAKPTPEELHALRIGAKRLRYRVELRAELGDGEAKARVKSLRGLQDRLGSWHDRQILLQTCAEFLSRKNFLTSHPRLARALLVEMEREQRRSHAAVDGLVKHAEKVADGFSEAQSPPTESSEPTAAGGPE